jgi:membrane dipeptidase
LLRVRAGYKMQTTMTIGRRSERDGGGARADEQELAEEGAHARLIGCSLDAVQLTRRCELIDLHVDTFIPYRMWGYDPLIRHRGGPFGRHFFGHLDVPRMLDGGLDGAMWSITTNPLRAARARWRGLRRNLARLRDVIARSAGRMVEVRSVEEYRAARAGGAHGCFLAIQGLNAVQAAPGGVRSLPDGIVRATLVHLTNAVYGATSSPLGIGRRDKGLTTAGREAVAELNTRRVFVDLAHIHERAFFDVAAVHDPAQPLLVSHTGVAGVRPHWRNLTDAQIRAIARTGGTIGIIFHGAFLRRRGQPADASMVAEHIGHVMRVAGEDFVSIGSDFDGAITPFRDLGGADRYPRLVQVLLERGVADRQIEKILGANFLRALAQLRPG